MVTPSEYLIAFDFDGTLADSFAKSPSGVGVNEASSESIVRLFGPEGERALTAIAGLQNRAPIELVEAVLSAGDRETMVAHARLFASEHLRELSVFVPEGKGVPLAPLIESEEITNAVLAEAFVRIKLAILTPEIGPEWPKPMPGVVEALRALRALSSEGARVHIAILSSGHESFIRRCLETWGAPEPDIFVTDDDLRAVPYLSSEEKVKPSVHLLARLHHAWRKKRGLKPDELDLLVEHTLRERGMLVFGDDRNRDGQLALQSDVYFGFYNPEEKATGEAHPRLIDFRDWSEFGTFLKSEGLRERLEQGETFGALWRRHNGEAAQGRKFV